VREVVIQVNVNLFMEKIWTQHVFVTQDLKVLIVLSLPASLMKKANFVVAMESVLIMNVIANKVTLILSA
jgi:hypothetical protein